MKGDGLEHIFDKEPHPEPYLDIPTIHEARVRLYGIIFAREVEIRQLEDPSFVVEKPETEEELIQAARELEEQRRAHKITRDKRDAEFIAYRNVSNMLDELENDAIKQLEQDEDIDIY